MRLQSIVRRPWRASGALLVASLCLGAPARGDDAGAGSSPDGGTPDGGAPIESPVADPWTAEVRALLGGTLDVAIDPQSLFDVLLSDEEAVQIEAVRVRALLRAVDESESARPAVPSKRGGAMPSASALPADSTRADIATVDPAHWKARVDLDRARLDFYSLPHARRDELLRGQAARREAAKPRETEEKRKAREAEQDRQQALAAAREARSEAERLVAGEVARLLGVERSIEAAREQFRGLHQDLVARGDTLLGWQRRTSDAETSAPADADATYDALRRTLRSSRDELDRALDALASSSSEVPDAGPDPLKDVPPSIPTDQARARRASVEKLSHEARAEERSLREERASTLQDEILALNRERLGLLPYLSKEKRDAVTGFTEAGLDQARSETRHLLLILRYHRHVATRWIRALRDSEGVQGVSLWRLAARMIPWLFAVLAFLWWRRRSAAFLTLAEKRIVAQDRSERRTLPSLARRALQLLRGVHRPLEWLLFFGATTWLLPAPARAFLEVQLLTVIVGWTLGGAFIVNTINAIATPTDTAEARAADDVGRLRLRSLRLVGRVVVAFALILVLSVRLVGEGTVYSWVLSTCWFAAVPVFLLLVRWWRGTVFERVDRVRRKSRLQAWLLANRTGWKSFLAAMIGAVHLFALGAFKTAVNWLVGFELARRAHAYLFKREIDRLAEGQPKADTRPLRDEARASLAPDRAGDTWIESPADEHLATLNELIAARRGGVMAVVGARGLGKTSLLRRLAALVEGEVTLRCDAHTSVATIRAALDAPARTDAAETSPPAPAIVLLDDAHALIKPLLRGLKHFDEILAHARAESAGTLWILAIDGAVWPFLRRARDARPLFDEVLVLRPWTDAQIGNLLSRRCEEAAITPMFEDLLEKLPPSADEVDKQEALVAKRTGYFQMVWDYARGNPGIALEVWRSSLVEDAEGNVRVRPLQAPSAARLEALPDSALFILRAVMQMSPATVADVAEATRLTEAQVQNAFRFGHAHGYLVEDRGRFRVTWAWLRAITLFLERRHLLVNS